MTPWVVEVGEIVANVAVGASMRHMTLGSPKVARLAAAGQFVLVRVPDEGILLPRPFDLQYADDASGTIEIVYRLKGRGTRALARLPDGSSLEVHGPFGRHADELLDGAERIAVIGRGAGISPLTFLASRARQRGVAVDAFLSARSPELLRPFQRLLGLSHVEIQTDLDQPGELVTTRLEREAQGQRYDAAFVVGSRRLARATLELSRRAGFRPYTYAEGHMGCGFGHCKACAIPTHSGYRLACLEGPLIDLGEVNDAYWGTLPG